MSLMCINRGIQAATGQRREVILSYCNGVSAVENCFPIQSRDTGNVRTITAEQSNGPDFVVEQAGAGTGWATSSRGLDALADPGVAGGVSSLLSRLSWR